MVEWLDAQIIIKIKSFFKEWIIQARQIHSGFVWLELNTEPNKISEFCIHTSILIKKASRFYNKIKVLCDIYVELSFTLQTVGTMGWLTKILKGSSHKISEEHFHCDHNDDEVNWEAARVSRVMTIVHVYRCHFDSLCVCVRLLMLSNNEYRAHQILTEKKLTEQSRFPLLRTMRKERKL